MQPQARISLTAGLVVVPGNREDLEWKFAKFRDASRTAAVAFARKNFDNLCLEDCEDLVSEALHLHWKQYLSKFGSDAEVPLSKSYLFRIIINKGLSMLRKKSNKTLGFDDVKGLDGKALEIDGYEQDFDQFRLDIRSLLQSLDPFHQTLIELLASEEMKYEEAAKLLNLPIGTIKSRYYRARQALTEAARRDPVIWDYISGKTLLKGTRKSA